MKNCHITCKTDYMKGRAGQRMTEEPKMCKESEELLPRDWCKKDRKITKKWQLRNTQQEMLDIWCMCQCNFQTDAAHQ